MAVQRRNTRQRSWFLTPCAKVITIPPPTKSTTSCARRMTKSAAVRSTAISISWPTRRDPLHQDAGRQPLRSHDRAACAYHLHLMQPRHRRTAPLRCPARRKRPSKSAGTSRRTTTSSRVSAPTASSLWDMPAIYLPIRYSKQYISRHVPNIYSASRRRSSSSTVRT